MCFEEALLSDDVVVRSLPTKSVPSEQQLLLSDEALLALLLLLGFVLIGFLLNIPQEGEGGEEEEIQVHHPWKSSVFFLKLCKHSCCLVLSIHFAKQSRRRRRRRRRVSSSSPLQIFSWFLKLCKHCSSCLVFSISFCKPCRSSKDKKKKKRVKFYTIINLLLFSETLLALFLFAFVNQFLQNTPEQAEEEEEEEIQVHNHRKLVLFSEILLALLLFGFVNQFLQNTPAAAEEEEIQVHRH